MHWPKLFILMLFFTSSSFSNPVWEQITNQYGSTQQLEEKLTKPLHEKKPLSSIDQSTSFTPSLSFPTGSSELEAYKDNPEKMEEDAKNSEKTLSLGGQDHKRECFEERSITYCSHACHTPNQNGRPIKVTSSKYTTVQDSIDDQCRSTKTQSDCKLLQTEVLDEGVKRIIGDNFSFNYLPLEGWWKRKHTYRCESDGRRDVQANQLIRELEASEVMVSQTSKDFSSVLRPALAQDAEVACVVSYEVQGETFQKNHLCKQGVCPLQAGETLVQDCEKPNHFGEVAFALQTANSATSEASERQKECSTHCASSCASTGKEGEEPYQNCKATCEKDCLQGNLRFFPGEEKACASWKLGWSAFGYNCCESEDVERFCVGEPQDGKTSWNCLEICSQSDAQTVEQKEKDLCEYYKTKDSRACDNPLICPVIETKKQYCCFPSKLSKIINVQGKQALGLSLEREGCRGLTMEEFQSLDFSELRFEEMELDVELDFDAVRRKAYEQAP